MRLEKVPTLAPLRQAGLGSPYLPAGRRWADLAVEPGHTGKAGTVSQPSREPSSLPGDQVGVVADPVNNTKVQLGTGMSEQDRLPHWVGFWGQVSLDIGTNAWGCPRPPTGPSSSLGYTPTD